MGKIAIPVNENRTHFSVKLVSKSAYGQCVTKNDVQNVHLQPAHKLRNDDTTDESLL